MLICCQSQTLASWAKDLPSPLACSHFPGTRRCKETPVVPGFSPCHLQIPTVLEMLCRYSQSNLYSLCCVPAVASGFLPRSWQSWYFSMHPWASSKNAEWMDSSWEDIRKLDPVIPLSQRAEPSQWLEDPDLWEWVELKFLSWHIIWPSQHQISEMLTRGVLFIFSNLMLNISV